MTIGKQLERVTSDSQSLAYDTVFFTLSNPRRRFVLHFLKKQHEPISTGRLAAEVAAWENDISVDEVSNRQRKRSYTALHQTHLPKMDDLGLVDYDASRGMVEPTDRVEMVDFYLEITPKSDLPWHEYYLGLTIILTGVVGGVVLAMYPFTLLSPVGWMGLVVGIYLLSAVVHVYESRKRHLGRDELPASLQRPLE